MRCDHPFAVDVRRTHAVPLGFIWSIKERGTLMQKSEKYYSTFEEARIALQFALAKQIITWRATQAALSQAL